MDTEKINRQLLNVRSTPDGLEWRMEDTLSEPTAQELATFLHEELGHKVIISVREESVFLSPKGNSLGGLVTFRQRVKELFPDPWAKSGQLDGEVDELPLE